jgi:hypothetical protein
MLDSGEQVRGDEQRVERIVFDVAKEEQCVTLTEENECDQP